MNANENPGLRERLLRLREDLQAAVQTAEPSSEPVELDQSRVGRLSRMDAMQVQAMAQASVRRREQMMKKIAVALSRIDSGDYGDCISCDEPISPKRLAIDPTAELCIDCAEKAEH